MGTEGPESSKLETVIETPTESSPGKSSENHTKTHEDGTTDLSPGGEIESEKEHGPILPGGESKEFERAHEESPSVTDRVKKEGSLDIKTVRTKKVAPSDDTRTHNNAESTGNIHTKLSTKGTNFSDH